MLVADVVAAALRAQGVERAYGLPGEDHMTLLDALERAGVTYRAAFNEAAAVLSAATDAQVSGVPGLVILSLAPGVSNGVNGLLHASMEEVPLLVVSGQHPAHRLPFVVRQGYDVERLLDPVTRWGARLAPGADVEPLVAKLLEVAAGAAPAAVPGPVHLILPDDVATADAAGTPASGRRTAVPGWRARTPAAPAGGDELDDLLERLTAARRPAIVVGGRRTGLTPATASSLAAALRAPVLTTSAQKGLLDGHDPWFAGTFLNGRLDAALLADSDLVLMVNPEAFDVYNRPPAFDAPVVSLSPAPLAEWQLPLAARVVGDPETTIAEVVRLLGEPASQWTVPEVAAQRRRLRETVLAGPDGFGVPAAVVAALAAVPADATLLADAGFSKPLVALFSEPDAPGRYLASNALSTMGYAIPAAIGALAAGASPVVAFVGDGSLLMRVTELAALAGSTAPLVVVALLDGSFTQIEIKQERRALAPVGATLPPLSARALGEALGVTGRDVGTTAELTAAVAEGVAGTGVLLVGAHVDPAPSRPVFEALRS